MNKTLFLSLNLLNAGICFGMVTKTNTENMFNMNNEIADAIHNSEFTQNDRMFLAGIGHIIKIGQKKPLSANDFGFFAMQILRKSHIAEVGELYNLDSLSYKGQLQLVNWFKQLAPSYKARFDITEKQTDRDYEIKINYSANSINQSFEVILIGKK